MSSQKTTNYDLNQWLPDDSVLRTDFNADNAKIDAALSAMSEQVVQKANQSALDTLITAVNQKAGQDDLTALEGTVAGHTAALTKLGNCEIQVTSYVGTGTYGEENPTVINFSKRPTFLMVMGFRCLMFATGDDTDQAWGVQRDGYYTANFTWNGNQARFWWDSTMGQMNYADHTYRVIAFYAVG